MSTTPELESLPLLRTKLYIPRLRVERVPRLHLIKRLEEKAFFDVLAGETPVINGSGEQARDFCYVGDIARANVLALDAGSGGIYNLGTGVGTSINEVFASLKDATGYKGDGLHGPAKLGEVFCIYLDASAAARDLGWQPEVSLDEGLKRTVAYFQKRD